MGNVERLEQAMADGKDAAALPQILEDLKAYAAYHGPVEERLMEAYDYPLRELHAMEHRQFLMRLAELERIVAEGHPAAAVQMLSRLRGWIERHIVDWDAKLGDFLNSRGIA